jgi:hypothetical protein
MLAGDPPGLATVNAPVGLAVKDWIEILKLSGARQFALWERASAATIRPGVPIASEAAPTIAFGIGLK